VIFILAHDDPFSVSWDSRPERTNVMNVLFAPSVCLPLSVARSPSTHLPPPSQRSSHSHGYQLRRIETHRRDCTVDSSTFLTPYTRAYTAVAIRSRIMRPCRTPTAVNSSALARARARLKRRNCFTCVLSGGSADRCGRRSPSGRWKPPTAPHFGNSPQFRTRWAHLAGQ
jgi:hypothetical protein